MPGYLPQNLPGSAAAGRREVLAMPGPADALSGPVALSGRASAVRRCDEEPAGSNLRPLICFSFARRPGGPSSIPLQIGYTISPGESEFPP